MRDFQAEYDALLAIRQDELAAAAEVYRAEHGAAEAALAIVTLGTAIVSEQLAEAGIVHACKTHKAEIEETTTRLFSTLVLGQMEVWVLVQPVRPNFRQIAEFKTRFVAFLKEQSNAEKRFDQKCDALVVEELGEKVDGLIGEIEAKGSPLH